MTDPKRLIDEGSSEFERELLAAHEGDGRSDRVLRSTLAAMGLGATTAMSTGAAAALGAAGGAGASGKAAASGASLGAWALMKWVGLGTLCGAAVVTATVLRSSPAHPPAAVAPARATESSAQPLMAARPASPQLSASADSPASIPTAVPRRPSLQAEVPVAPSAPEAAPLATLQAEVAALDRVRAALAAGNGAEALQRLDAWQREFPRGKLGPEATVLRIEALVVTGNRDAARGLARTFLASPASAPHATRVRSLVGEMTNP